LQKITLLLGRILPTLFTIVAAANLGGCQGELPDRQASVEPTAFRPEIDKLRSAYEAAVAAGDTKAMGTLLADGAIMVRPGGPDWDAMAVAASGAPFPPGAKIAISPIEVVAMSKEWAYEFGTSITTYTPEGSDKKLQLRDTYLILFRRTDKGWQAYREVASSTPPPGGWPE
jgi:ketosteroid isomerase-like protein